VAGQAASLIGELHVHHRQSCNRHSLGGGPGEGSGRAELEQDRVADRGIAGQVERWSCRTRSVTIKPSFDQS
jgi:hypothetical protein